MHPSLHLFFYDVKPPTDPDNCRRGHLPVIEPMPRCKRHRACCSKGAHSLLCMLACSISGTSSLLDHRSILLTGRPWSLCADKRAVLNCIHYLSKFGYTKEQVTLQPVPIQSDRTKVYSLSIRAPNSTPTQAQPRSGSCLLTAGVASYNSVDLCSLACPVFCLPSRQHAVASGPGTLPACCVCPASVGYQTAQRCLDVMKKSKRSSRILPHIPNLFCTPAGVHATLLLPILGTHLQHRGRTRRWISEVVVSF